MLKRRDDKENGDQFLVLLESSCDEYVVDNSRNETNEYGTFGVELSSGIDVHYADQ